MQGRLWFAGLCFVLATGAVQALELGKQVSDYQASPELRWLEAAPGALSPENALAALRSGKGQRLGSRYPSMGFRKQDQWFLLNLDNQSDTGLWYLHAGRPHLDYLDMYVYDQAGTLLDHQRSGDRVPFAARPFPHHQLIYPLAIPQQAQWSILFRARGDNVIDFPLSIHAPDEFNQHDGYLKLSYGFYFGSVLIMCLFNLLIFFSIREPSYLLYVLYLGLFGLNLFAREGLAYQWLWPQASEWNHRSLPVLNLLTLAFSMFFSCSFLELKKAAPGLNRVLILIGLALIALAPFTLLNFTFFIQFSSAIIFPWPFIAIALSIWSIRQGYQPARFFLLAFTAVGLASVIYILKTFNLIGGSWLIENTLQLGTVTEALLLSFALAHRMTTLKSENERIPKEAQEALERRVEERTHELNTALSARSEFLAVMSHEIRTPLNGIIGTVDMLRDSQLDETQQRQLYVIEQSGNTLLDLINDVLDYSRLDAGKMPIEQTRLDLPALIGECVALFEHRARLNANSLVENLDSDLGDYCVGDPVRLRQILVNLISNAVKFTENGRIEVAARRDEANRDYVLFEITDSGVGIAADQQSRLFDYFHQGDQTSRRRYGGTGLGLAICRQLAEIMGGEIGFRSSEARGSCFWVRLPLPIGKAQAESPPTETERPAGVVGARLLIVDDNHINLLVAEGLCRKLGHQCETAESGAEALAVLLSRPGQFDLVLMDCEMPDMDGFETTRAIQGLQRQGRLPVIPVIALTAHAVPDKIAACHDAGMVGHIAKPVNLRRLDESLSGALRGMANSR